MHSKSRPELEKKAWGPGDAFFADLLDLARKETSFSGWSASILLASLLMKQTTLLTAAQFS